MNEPFNYSTHASRPTHARMRTSSKYEKRSEYIGISVGPYRLRQICLHVFELKIIMSKDEESSQMLNVQTITFQ